MVADEDGDDTPEWRRVKIRIDVENDTCDVTVGGETVLEGVSLPAGIIPSIMCIGVCATAAAGKFARLCVNDIVLIDEDED